MAGRYITVVMYKYSGSMTITVTSDSALFLETMYLN